MAPFSVAQLKDKASSVKSSSSDKFQSVRHKLQSRSSADSSYDHRDLRTKAPPPPRTSFEAAQAASALQPLQDPGPPPPVRRSTRPDTVPLTHIQAKGDDAQVFRWSSISNEDKGLFFGWLDDFFDARLRSPGRSNQLKQTTGASNGDKETHSRSEQGSSAENFSKYFSPATGWDEPWYCSQQPTPPPLATSTDGMRTHSIQWRGNSRTLTGGVLFNDLSACWYTVTWADNTAHDVSLARRSAEFTPRPVTLAREDMIAAHKTYGETVASFAEGYENTGEWCARGECWDLANEALKAFERWDYVPKPLPSVGTTHGCLMYHGSAWGRNVETEQEGNWRGGDDRIRRGDIIQWKSAKVVDGNRSFTLGNPDHTAIIVRDQQPLKTPFDNQDLGPADLGSIEVVEQSRQSPPARQLYNLRGMVSGEIWIYRPVGMEAYLKFNFSATRPNGLQIVRSV